jgi:rhodanese-related sulfurtransferase
MRPVPCLRILLGSVICAAAIRTGTCADVGQTSETIARLFARPEVVGSYCGIHSLFAAMTLLGRGVTAESLVRPEYIGSFRGSSLKELEKAARDHGLHTALIGGLNWRALKGCPYPVILHVKPSLSVRQYNHYELYMGTAFGQARLYDPSYGVHVEPFHVLSARWDGNGLVVGTSPIATREISRPARTLLFLVAGTCALALLLLFFIQRLVRKKWPWRSPAGLLGKAILELLAISLGVAALSLVVNSYSTQGLLFDFRTTVAAINSYPGAHTPLVSASEVDRLVKCDGVLVVDARLSRDFALGHLHGAVNVPVNCDDSRRREIMSHVPKSALVVLYCESDSCPFAEGVATDLVSDGFLNLLIYRGGWRDWQNRRNADKPSAQGRS